MSLATLLCVACAPETDQSSLQDQRGTAPAGYAGAAAQAGHAGAATTGGAGKSGSFAAPPTGLGTAGIPGTAVGGVAGRPATAGTPGMTMLPGRGPGAAGTPGFAGNPGSTGAAGMTASAGSMSTAMAGTTGSTDMGGPCGSGMPTDGRPTTGPLACIVEQHNAVRAMVKDTATPLPPVTWSADLAKYAQEWTDMTCMSPMHRSNPMMNGKPLGENLFAAQGGMVPDAGKQAVDGWAAEVACYTFGKFMTGDKCDMSCTTKMHSDGCGHYTQVVWRGSTQIGCGVTQCGSGFQTQTEVICNYAPAGNYVGMNPY
jgi:hypothetical protein